ncbi:MAG: AAA family ATPase [Deltaproteobacteria bacterium]|nr:AAA family ATPase [Deltaproteobacteria bacterium]
MRLKRLELKAFGPFTDRTLEFDSEEPGLHIIYGPNEAGKSSSLRALKALLYGFPERTSDNFQHANDQLLVGGCLQAADGREITFQRRKKRKADLLGPDGDPLEPGALSPYLHGIEPALFESLYGIDHQTLVKGGEDILAQKGEVGQALFAAGAGISSLRGILDSLDAEADELFKSRGSKQRINQAVNEYKKLKKTVKEASLSAATWKEHHQRLKDAEAELAELEDESKRKSAEVQRLERLHRAIPELAALENLKKQLRDFGAVVVLPPGFPEQLRKVERKIRELNLQLEKDRVRLAGLRARRDGISFNRALFDHAEAIEDLHQRLGEYRKGRKDRSRLDGMRISNRQDAGDLIRNVRADLTLEDVESLRPVLVRKRTIQKLSSQHEALTQQASQARQQKDEAAKELKEITGVLAGRSAVRESDGLAKALKLARRAGDLDGQLEELARQVDGGKKACRAALKRSGLWTGELAQLLELPLPSVETVRRFEADYGELENDRKQLRKDLKKAAGELQSARADSREVAYGGEVPTEQDLAASRRKRQEGWRLLRRQWLDGEDIAEEAAEYEPGRAVHDAYEGYVELADHLADRLRREAALVARAASLRARIEGLEETIKELAEQEQELAGREENLAAAWQAEWKTTKIKPLPPKEMLAWLAEIDTLRFRLTEISGKEGEAQEKDKARQRHRRALVEELRALGESGEFPGRELAPVLVFAESVLEDIARHKAELEKLNDRRTRLRKALARAGKEQADVAAAWNEWQASWDKALTGLGLADRVSPGEALDLLDIIDNCFSKLEKAKEFQSRIAGIDRDVDKFSNDVQTLLEQAAPDLRNLPLDQAVLQLHTMLGRARQDSKLLEENNAEAEGLILAIQEAEKTRQSLDGQMAELLATAGCDKETDLAGAISRSVEYQRLQEKVSEAETTFAKVAEGVPIEEIKQQAAAVSVDELPGRIVSLRRQVDEELYPRIKDISKVIGEENRELQSMDGSGRAAEAAEKMEQVAARIRRLVDQYVLIKVAAMVLKDEIERYRKEHQDPVLRLASRYFADLTIGSFAGLRTDIDDKGEPVLVGLRPDDTRVSAAGMSSGTRDQLYLALRLATLESRLRHSEPMPFIVDDILINFDDARSRATLKVLAGLAQRNQVILFTHHGQVVAESRKLSGGDPVYVHELRQ